jgi:protein O-GlcNAc transferase
MNSAPHQATPASAISRPAAQEFARLGAQFFAERRYSNAVEAYERALDLRPDYPAVLSNLGAACSLAGEPEKSERYLRRAIRIAPDFLAARSNLLLLLHYANKWKPAQIAAEHKRMGQAWTRPESPLILRKPLRPGRRLRIGYVSSDFRRHPVAHFIAPLLAHHDRRRFEVMCYYSAPLADEFTARFTSMPDRWRTIAGIDDDHAAEVIRKDKCDILIDLNGHTQGNRLGIFARRAAPVQATYLGYPDGTGLVAMQYRLTDSIADPPGRSDARYVETLVRLSPCFLCFRPSVRSPRVQAERSDSDRCFTFGSLNQYQKLSDFTLELWAEILHSVPRARLLLQSMSMDDPRTKDSLRQRFERLGVDRCRLELAGYSRTHLDTYNRIDLALDTFPFHGATTTCEALWMGKPVVSLAGTLHVSRMGTTVLTNLGLDEFIARTRKEYVSIACECVENPERLKKVSAGLRRRFSQSALRDEVSFTKNFEAALVAMSQE